MAKHIHYKTFRANSLEGLEQMVNEYFEANPGMKLKEISAQSMEITSDPVYVFWILFEHDDGR